MNVRVLLLSAAVLLAAGFATADDDPEPPKRGLDKLQGEWEMVSLETRGKKGGNLKTRLTVKGAQWILGGNPKKGGNPPVIKVDASKKPMTIDLYPANSNRPTWRGIYKLEGDTLTLCRVQGGKDRPTKFETTEEAGVLVVWKRVKK
jgi:uncharacterized protein (TIGR03067 family)